MDSIVSNWQQFWDNSALSQFKQIIEIFKVLIDKVTLFIPAPLLPFISLGFVVSVIYLIIGRNND